MNPRASKHFPSLSAAFAGAALLFVGAAASAADLPDASVVVLSASVEGQLIAAYPHGLYRIDTGAGTATRLPLPAAAQRAIAAVVGGGDGARIHVATPGAGLWSTDDAGRSWEPRNAGLPGGPVTALAHHASQPDTLYAYVSGQGIYRTENAGAKWQLMDAGPQGMTGPLIHSDMPGSMQTGWLFVATQAGVSRAMDCFCLWRKAGDLPAGAKALTFDPREPAHIYAAAGEAILRSTDGGETWEKIGAPGADIVALAATRSGKMYAGGAGGQLYRSTDGGNAWERMDAAL